MTLKTKLRKGRKTKNSFRRISKNKLNRRKISKGLRRSNKFSKNQENEFKNKRISGGMLTIVYIKELCEEIKTRSEEFFNDPDAGKSVSYLKNRLFKQKNVCDEKDVQDLIKSSTIIGSEDKDFIDLVIKIYNYFSYKFFKEGVKLNVGKENKGLIKKLDDPELKNYLYHKIVQILIYNRPLTFYGESDETNQDVPTPENQKYLKSNYPYFNHYKDGENPKNEKYELVALAALFGVSCKSYVINDGNRGNSGKIDENYTKNGGTKAYICGLVGARFERTSVYMPSDMEYAYLFEEPLEERFVLSKLREFFLKKVSENNNKYFQQPTIVNNNLLYRAQEVDMKNYINKNYISKENIVHFFNLLRERLRFTFEIFLDNCLRIYDKEQEKLCVIITGLGAEHGARI